MNPCFISDADDSNPTLEEQDYVNVDGRRSEDPHWLMLAPEEARGVIVNTTRIHARAIVNVVWHYSSLDRIYFYMYLTPTAEAGTMTPPEWCPLPSNSTPSLTFEQADEDMPCPEGMTPICQKCPAPQGVKQTVKFKNTREHKPMWSITMGHPEADKFIQEARDYAAPLSLHVFWYTHREGVRLALFTLESSRDTTSQPPWKGNPNRDLFDRLMEDSDGLL
jgi:hypothetical protein